MVISTYIVTFIAGIIYGCSFVLQQGSILSTVASRANHLQLIFFIALRFAILGTTLWHVLRTPGIQSILVIMPFIGAFWLVILVAKVAQYEWSRTHNR